MVFEYKPGRTASKAPELPHPPTWTHDTHDPFPKVEVIREQPARERVSWLGDAGLWVQQLVSECARLARQYDALKAKLEDPKLASHPARQKHIYRAEALWDDMVQAARDAMWTEAEGDRVWQTLTWKQRDEIAHHWHTPCSTDRLIGRAWYGIALFETWPRRFRLSRLWTNDFPQPLVEDLQAFGVWTWRPVADPPDPFGGEIVVDTKLAMELDRRT